MRLRLTIFVFPALVALVLPACAYKKEVKDAAIHDLECEPSLVKVKKRRGVLTSRGCGNVERYIWHCEGKLCKLCSFSDAINEGAFAADCPPEEMVPVVIDNATLAVDGCDKRIVFKATLKGWVNQGGTE
jgi:hypothetical protein